MTNSSGAAGAKFYRSFAQIFCGEAGKTARERILVGFVSVVGIGWLTWISSPFLLMGRLGYVRANELGDAVYPQVAYVVRMLRAGQFSLWLPAQAGGTDLLGNFNAPYLNVLLYVLLPPWLANNLIITIVFGVAGLSTYLLLRRSFNCSRLLACAGGFLYGSWFLINFGGLVFAYAAGLAFALAPLVLDWLLRARSLTLKSVSLSVILGFVFAAGGHYTWSIFLLGAVFICAILLAPRRLVRWLPHLGIVGFVTILCQWPIILANVQTAAFSARTAEAYYRANKLFPLIENYFGHNPPFSPYGELVLACTLLVGVAVALSNRRWSVLKSAWPALAFALLFVLLPVIDIAVLYTLSALNVGGFSLDPNGDFGGPFDCRLRISRAFIASASAALSADLFWREILMPATSALTGVDWRRIVHLWQGGLSRAIDEVRSVDWRQLVRFRGINRDEIATRMKAIALGSRQWLRRIKFSHVRRLGEVALVVVVLYGSLGAVLHLFDRTAATVLSMRRMAVYGMSFSAYYRHPQLLDLAAHSPDVEAFRVATVQLNAPDTVGGCCEPREASFFAGFQVAYNFQIADAYMSNLTRRSVNFWDLAITGHPGFPRADFDEAYRRRFLYPGQAFTQKLYLFQPIGAGAVGADGCIRQTTPIDFAASYNLDMLSLDNVKFIVSGIPLHDPRLTLLESAIRDELSALQCASEAERRAAFDAKGLVGRPLYIYRNEEAAPRVFAPRALEVAPDENAVYRALLGRSIAQLKHTALVAKTDLAVPLAHAGNLQVSIGKVTVVRGDHLQIETSSDAGGILIVSDSYSPYWGAEARGKPLPLFPAYHTFIGIAVPPGRHTVDLRYRPPYARFLGYGKND